MTTFKKLYLRHITTPTIMSHKEVKIRGPSQGLGPIPASKNEVLGPTPESKKSCCGKIPPITGVVIPEQHF